MNIQTLYELYRQHPQVQTDTRQLQQGDLYFALKGAQFNGNLFAKDALEKGAAYAIVDEETACINDRCILVPDVLQTLQQLALHHRRQFTIPFIAITGTNGKTTTKELVTQVLSAKFKTYATAGNLNNHIGVPLTILCIKPDAEIAIIEMGANHQHEIEFYCQIAEPNFGLINNVGKAHLEGFGGLEGVRKAKGELYDYIRTHKGSIFINNDLPYLLEMAEGIAHQITYGSRQADVVGIALADSPLLKVAMMSKQMETTIQTKLVGDFNLPNVLAAVAIGHHFGMDIDTIKAALEAYEPSNSRSQLLEIGTNTLILDAYNANPSSMKLALENLARTKTEKTKWAMLGAMKEMGEVCEAEHRALVQLAKDLELKNIVLVGHEFKNLEQDFLWFENSDDAAAWISAQQIDNAMILIKGSRGAKMEVACEAFKPKN